MQIYHNKKLFRLLLLLILASCTPPVTFDQPQPPNTKAIYKFPSQLWGKYLCSDGKSTVIINLSYIIEFFDYDLKAHKDSLDSDYRIKGDTLFRDSTGEYEIIKLQNDTIIKHESYTDTVFVFKDDSVLKKFKGHYFLNYEWDENAWIVKKMTLVKGILSIADINTTEEVVILNEITESPKDTISYGFKTTKRDFKKFLEQGGFKESKIYIKIK